MSTVNYSFIGDYGGRTDAKNRITLPAAFKRMFEGEENVSLIVKKDLFEKCLLIYPRQVWDALMSELRCRIDPYKRDHAKFLREYQKNTCEVSLDANGRILLPQRLLDLIGATKDLTFLGVDDHIELWDSAQYSALSLSEDQLGQLADALFSKKDI